MDVYEFKLASSARWESTPVFSTTHNLTQEQAKEQAKEYAAFFGVECRFNVRGSLQGHYVGGRLMAVKEVILSE